MANLAVAHQFVSEMTAPRVWLLLLLPLLLFVAARYYSRARKTQQQPAAEHVDDVLPPSPPALPILGHLHLVAGSALPHVALDAVAKKHGHGDLMLLRLGAMPVLVVSSPRAAEAVLRTHDHAFASRPHSVFGEVVMSGPSDIGLSPYGEYWRQARKLSTAHLLSAHKVRSFRRAREEEVRVVLARIREAAAAGAAVDVGDLVGSFTHDLLCRGVMGESFWSRGRNELLRQLIADTSPLVAGFNVEEFFPLLARLGVFSKAVRAKSERLKRRWDDLLDQLIQEHDDENNKQASDDGGGEGFMHVLLSVRHEYRLTTDNIKAILLGVFFAGIDTSSSVLDFTMAELMRRPDAMHRLQAEVRSVVPEGQGQEGGSFSFVGEDSLRDMPYLRAVVKESLRLHPVAPLLLPHFSMATCRVDGNTVVPAGVRVLVNAWAMGRDARFWDRPLEFAPERFLDGGGAAGVSFNGNDFQFLPFGSGRRMCGGINYAMVAVELMLANLVQGFDWEMPEGKDSSDIDMDEVFGLVVRRKDKLLLVPKLPHV